MTRPARPAVTQPLAPPGAAPTAESVVVAGVREGDARAFGEMFQRHYDGLCRFAYSYVASRATAEEVVSDVFLGLWRGRAAWDPSAGIERYLYGAIRNRALNELKHERVAARWRDREARDVLALDPHLAPSDAERWLAQADVATVVRRVVEQLPPRTRRVFELRWYHQLSNADVAAVMGTTVKTVKIQVGAALRVLRERLGGRERPD
jgi:RNA polymerase sigma-70 factor (ECF subfamily)